MAWRPVLAVALAAGVVHLAVATRFGWHRDEFYQVTTGRHLDWGFPDQPPVTPLLARLVDGLPGGLLPLRLLAIAAQLGCVLLAARLAAEFGGRARAQTIAAAAIAACPAFVGGAMMFSTTVTDQLAWAAVFVTVAAALRSGTVRSWLAAGAVAGLGLENKHTIGVLLLGVTAGLVLFHRPVLRTPGPWLAGALALLLALPNVLWNVRHGWPQLRMAGVLSADQGGPLGSLANLPLLVLIAGLPLVMLWVFGVRRLASAAGRGHRWALVAAATALVVFTAGGGKLYYPAPGLLALFAAGAVLVEDRAARAGAAARPGRSRWTWPVLLATSGLIAVLTGLPVLPVGAATALRPVNPEPVETYGWPEFVGQVAAAARSLPAGTPIFTANYGEAGALTLLGPDAGLRSPVVSAHNAYGLWGPPPGTPDPVLCVGQWSAEYLRRFWSDVRPVASITLPGGIITQEVDENAAIFTCRGPRGDWARLWPALRHLD
ncbi:glycosyltransferase family 39 protein [Sphaerisporangium rufum]|nr:glycosyltransferase family 39 protein [Sphaerisporangium rufum]